MNADRLIPAPPHIRDKKRWRRLKTQVAKEIGRGERIQASYDIILGYAMPDGRFESVRANNFRYARQLLGSLQGRPHEERRNLIAVARYIRLDETRYQSKQKHGGKSLQIP